MRARSIILVAPLLCALLASSCERGYDHQTEVAIGEITIRIGLRHSHPFLAEYRKYLEIEQSGVVQRKEIFQDTGGYAWVALTKKQGILEVRDLGGVQFSATLGGSSAESEFLGRFDFDSTRTYRFIPSTEDRREPQIAQ